MSVETSSSEFTFRFKSIGMAGEQRGAQTFQPQRLRKQKNLREAGHEIKECPKRSDVPTRATEADHKLATLRQTKVEFKGNNKKRGDKKDKTKGKKQSKDEEKKGSPTILAGKGGGQTNKGQP